MPSSLKILMLLKFPSSWLLILISFAEFVTSIGSNEKQKFVASFPFLILALVAEVFVIINSRELYGLKKIDFIAVVNIVFKGALKLFMFPALIVLIVSVVWSYSTGGSFEIIKFDSTSPLALAGYGIFALWISLGINFAIYTNSIKDLAIVTFNVLKLLKKELLPPVSLYLIIYITSGLIGKNSTWGSICSLLFQFLAVFFFRLWFFEIFSMYKLAPKSETKESEC